MEPDELIIAQYARATWAVITGTLLMLGLAVTSHDAMVQAVALGAIGCGYVSHVSSSERIVRAFHTTCLVASFVAIVLWFIDKSL